MTARQSVDPALAFNRLNRGFNAVFRPGQLSIGLVVPVESYSSHAVPTMEQHLERAQRAEGLGFPALWLRDVPFNVPSFGDAGQPFDPFVYLGALAIATSTIALGVASIVLPLRHPAHVAKAAASVDVLSDGRLLLGIASGDRPDEYPALNQPFEQRGERFRDSYDYLRQMATSTPQFANPCGRVGGGMDLLPKPVAGTLPLLVTGSSQQGEDWIASHGDGWITYPRPSAAQEPLIAAYRSATETTSATGKPVMEPLYLDLAAGADATPTPIHLGLRTGMHGLRDYLRSRRAIGVNHVALNLRFNRADIDTTLAALADELLPEFS